jgi:hypothetical protein
MSLEPDNLDYIKKKLSSYNRTDIIFNEPHFTNQLLLRDGSREQVIDLILSPSKLVYSYQEIGKYGAVKHCLIFNVSNTLSLRIPVIFDIDGRKNLYILTYIARYRIWKVNQDE